MRRRSGQKGTVVIQSGFYRVRWRIDVDGQEARINMSQIIVPLVLDKDGNPKPPSPQIRRKAKEIVEQSGANSEARFREVTLGEITFREQAEAYLQAAVSRKRNPLRDTVSVEGALSKWLLSANRRLATQPSGQPRVEANRGEDVRVVESTHGEQVRRIRKAGCRVAEGSERRTSFQSYLGR